MQSFTIDGIIVMPPLIAEYKLDPTIITQKENLSFEQGYNFEYHNFLYNTRDTSINKYSQFTLTDETNVVDYFDIRDIPFEYPVNHTTYLSYNTVDTDPFSGLSAVSGSCLTSVSATTALNALSANNNLNATYITITDDVTLEEDGTNSRPVSAERFLFRRTKPSLPQKYYFNVMLIDAVNCYIYHQDGDSRWYLSQKDEPGEVLKFTKVDHVQGFEDLLDQIEKDGGDKIKFQYNKLPKSNIRIYKQFDGKTHVLKMLTPEERELQPLAAPVRLAETTAPDNDGELNENVLTINELTDYSTIKMRPGYRSKTFKKLIPTITNYDDSVSNHSLNVSDKTINHKTNMLVHSEYYYLTGESIPINFFSLKNDQTPHGITQNNVLDTRFNSVYTNRLYNKIDTGTNQLGGSNHISLEYSTNTHSYTFNPGMNYFNTPQDLGPFNKININDTNLVSSGAIPGATPAQSDKIYKNRKANDLYSKTTRWGKSKEEQLGTWLCTWLSGGNHNEKPVWVDRYYNPSDVGYVEALTQVTEFVHNRYTTSSLDIFKSITGAVIDKPSELTLEPGMNYAYYRISQKDIDNCLSLLDPHHIQSGLSNYKTLSNKPGTLVNGEYSLDGIHTGEISTGQSLQDIGELSLTFDINLKNFKTTQNHQLIGNYTSFGMGFFQRNDVSPFMFLLGSDGRAVDNQLQNSSIRIYNNEFKLYNYITNDSFLTDEQTPGLFHSLIVRELPEDIFAVTTVGDIVEITHDGIVKANYTQWRTQFADPHQQQTGFAPTMVSTCFDERFIYILSHVGTNRKDYTIHQFDMVSKQFQPLHEKCKTFLIDIPTELTSQAKLKNRGRLIPSNTPPNFLSISDGSDDYEGVRTLYLTTGDDCKNSKRYIWTKVSGDIHPISGIQTNHDLLYCFDKQTLNLQLGLLTDNNLIDSTNPLLIIDYVVDSDEKIWIIHNENILSIFTSSRKLVKTTTLDEQQGVSMVVTRDYTDDGTNNIVDRVCILGNTAGTETLQLQIGPDPHPTNILGNFDYRKASPWIDQGNVYDRSRFTDTTSAVYDDLTEFDDTTQIVYPFVDGASRFGEHVYEIDLVPSSDPTGRVLDGDYELVTEDFNYIVNEDVNIVKGNIFDAKTCNLVATEEVVNLVIDDLSNLPQLINHYEYSVLNFQRYTTNNFNCKLNLQPLYKSLSPDRVNIKLDLDQINEHPYTGYVNITLNINNTVGKVEMWVNGQLDPSRVYTYDVNKYRFTNILSKKIIIGATPFLNDTLLYSKLNTTNKYIVKDVNLKNINLYTKCLDMYDILNHIRRSTEITNLSWEIPTSQKNYIETIERMFNHSIPPRKSNMYDIVIRNSSIRSLTLQNYISGKVRRNLNRISPAGTGMRTISWSNELLDFTDSPEDSLNYNPIADEIIVDPSGLTLPAYLPYVLQ